VYKTKYPMFWVSTLPMTLGFMLSVVLINVIFFVDYFLGTMVFGGISIGLFAIVFLISYTMIYGFCVVGQVIYFIIKNKKLHRK